MKRRTPLPAALPGPHALPAPEDLPAWDGVQNVLLRVRPANFEAGADRETKTGSHCPLSGMWTTEIEGQTVEAWINEGELMPPTAGAAATWTYRGGRAGTPGRNGVSRTANKSNHSN